MYVPPWTVFITCMATWAYLPFSYYTRQLLTVFANFLDCISLLISIGRRRNLSLVPKFVS